MADAAMTQSDTNSDGILDANELLAAPGLKAAAEAEGGSADVNGDGKLTKDEIKERIAYYQQRATGMENVPMNVLLAKQALAGATVEIIPEPFLAGVLTPATTTTRDNGFALLETVKPGMYRVKVTHPSGIPPKYNDSTTLGIEVIQQREGYSSGPKQFNLEKK
jgi:hypothetical protein